MPLNNSNKQNSKADMKQNDYNFVLVQEKTALTHATAITDKAKNSTYFHKILKYRKI